MVSVWRCVPRLFVSMLLLSAVQDTQPLAAQGHPLAVTVDTIGSSPQCDTCRLLLLPSITFHSSDSVALGVTYNIAASGDRTFITPQDATDRVHIFSSDGAFVETVTAVGDVQFEYITALGVVADSLWVMGAGRRDAVVFSQDMRKGRTVPLNFTVLPRGLLPLPSGKLAINGLRPSPDFFGISMFEVDREGVVTGAYGGGPMRVEMGAQATKWPVRYLTPAAAGGFWSAPVYDYAVSFWAEPGERPLRTLLSQPGWFVETNDDPVPATGTDPYHDVTAPIPPPLPAMVDLHESEDGRLLFVLGLTPQAGWQSAVGEIDVRDWSGYWDGIIEVIDLENLVLLARSRMDEMPLGFGPNGTVYTLSAGGHPRIIVNDLSFQIGRRE